MSRAPFPFKMDEVVVLCGFPYNGEAQRTYTCPECGKKKLGVDFSKEVCHCFSCDFTGNALSLYAKTHMTDNKTAYGQILDELKGEDVQHKLKDIQKAEVESMPLADIRVRHRTYSIMLKLLPLSKDHEENLVGRGFKDISMFRTIDPKWNDQLVEKLLKYNCQLSGVPGFYQSSGQWKIMVKDRGILVPYFDHNGRIQGFQIRKDEPKSKPKGWAKYTWLSAAGLKDGETGTKSKSFASYAGEDYSKGKMILTEGSMKGLLTSQITGYPVLSLAGVSNYGTLQAEVQYIKSTGCKVLIAWDMDRFYNPNVRRSLRKIEAVLSEAGIPFKNLTWGDSYWTLKGERVRIDEGFAALSAPSTRELKVEDFNRHLKILKDDGVEKVFFTFRNSTEMKEYWNVFLKTQEFVRSKGIDLVPVFYYIVNKGVDDEIVARKRGLK